MGAERGTPETDAVWKARRPDSPETAAAELDSLARKLERQRDVLAEGLEAAVNMLHKAGYRRETEPFHAALASAKEK